MASQKQLESTRISKQGYSNTQVSAPSLAMVAGGKQCAPRSTIAPLTTRSANFHRCVKRRVGCPLKRVHCKRVLVSARKQTAYKLSRIKGSVSSFKRVPRPLCGQDSPSGHRQYNCGAYINKEGGMRSGPLCALLWRILTWCTQRQVTLKARHIPGRLKDPSEKSGKSESPCMAPRATTIKEQGFSKAVATRIEAPQRRSTRAVYEAKWTIFTKWCITNKVNFRAPPINSVAGFLMYLFEDRKLQPSTIDGYRSAIADKLGNPSVNISKDENLTRLLDSFHRDRPKGRRGIPSWNLSLVLHPLAKAPFEPLKDASMKHLTFKTVFLLALGSGKRRSEIHAWQHKNIRHQSDWSKVSLYPSPSFLSNKRRVPVNGHCVS